MKKSKFDNYVPFGNEWKAEMMKLKKDEIIEMFKTKAQENKILLNRINYLEGNVC